MDNFTLDRISAYIILDVRRAKKNTDKYPVKYRVCYLRKCIYYPSGRYLNKDEFILLDDPGKMKNERKLISAGFDKIKEQITELVNGEGFSLEMLSRRLSRGTKDSVYDAFKAKIDDLTQSEKLGTAELYSYTLKSLKEYAGEDMKFHQVTKTFLQQYEKELLRQGKSFTTISMYMRNLRSIINEAKSHGIIRQAQYPFGKGKYEIPMEEKRKLALSISQIKQVVDYPLSKETDRKCRDLWLFIYLASGINMVDLLKLKYKNIRNGKIYYYRQKTMRKKVKKEIVVVLLPMMKEIIDTWGNPDRKPENYIFPVLTDSMTPAEERLKVKNMTHLVNDKMTAIGEELGIGRISTYTGRHSYATIQKRSGTSVEFISEQLGHSDVGVTENYLDSFEDEEMYRNAEKLLKFD
jgi:integrase